MRCVITRGLRLFLGPRAVGVSGLLERRDGRTRLPCAVDRLTRPRSAIIHRGAGPRGDRAHPRLTGNIAEPRGGSRRRSQRRGTGWGGLPPIPARVLLWSGGGEGRWPRPPDYLGSRGIKTHRRQRLPPGCAERPKPPNPTSATCPRLDLRRLIAFVAWLYGGRFPAGICRQTTTPFAAQNLLWRAEGRIGELRVQLFSYSRKGFVDEPRIAPADRGGAAQGRPNRAASNSSWACRRSSSRAAWRARNGGLPSLPDGHGVGPSQKARRFVAPSSTLSDLPAKKKPPGGPFLARQPIVGCRVLGRVRRWSKRCARFGREAAHAPHPLAADPPVAADRRPAGRPLFRPRAAAPHRPSRRSSKSTNPSSAPSSKTDLEMSESRLGLTGA